MNTERNLALVPIAPEILVSLLEEGEHHYRLEGLPKGAEGVGAGYDIVSHELYLVVRHSSFKVATEGVGLPKLMIICHLIE